MENLIDMITRFEIGNVYEMRFIGDSDLKVAYICTHRTKKMATLEKFKGNEILKRKINIADKVEYIRAGNYSMAPTIYSDKVIH